MPSHRAAIIIILGLVVSAQVSASINYFPSSVAEGRQSLDRVGYGEFRYARIIDVYAAAFYLPEGRNADLPVDSRTPKRLDLYYLRDVPRKHVVAAAEKVLRKQLTAKAYKAIKPKLDHWHKNIVDAVRGDRFSLVFDGRNLTLRHNDSVISQSDSHTLAQAYFGIWLGKPAISDKLRSQLLNSESTVLQRGS